MIQRSWKLTMKIAWSPQVETALDFYLKALEHQYKSTNSKHEQKEAVVEIERQKHYTSIQAILYLLNLRV